MFVCFLLELKGSLYVIHLCNWDGSGVMKCNVGSGSIQDPGWWEQGWEDVAVCLPVLVFFFEASLLENVETVEGNPYRKRKSPWKGNGAQELRVDTNMHDNKWRKRQKGDSKEGTSRAIEQSIPGYTALPESIWGSCGCHSTELRKEVWYYWRPELD